MCGGFVMRGCFDNCVGVLVICVLVFTVFCIVCTVFWYCFCNRLSDLPDFVCNNFCSSS